jgi:putative NIF3 family GTP cyclohydrolase 1 type 2
MKLNDLFRRAIEAGIDADPRGRTGVQEALEREKKEYDALSERDKQWFNTDRLWNPFTDTNLFNGDHDTDVKRIAVGVDCDNSELLLIHELNRMGRGIDALVAHHPAGRNMDFHRVMGVQVDMLEEWGIPITKAEALMNARMAEVHRGILPSNTRRHITTAQLLNVPFMSLHSPADVLVQGHVQRTVDAAKPRTVGDVIDLLTDSYEEYLTARKMQEAMDIFAGAKKNRCGKVVVKMAGGTQGPTAQFEAMAAAGIGTVVCMHLRDDAVKEAEKHNINVLVAGHMASDSIGLNLLIAAVDPAGELDVLPISGFIHVNRR